MQQTKHIGVYGIITEEDNILLIKKARGPYIGKWDLPGGSLEFGEGVADGLAREIMEETGLFIKSHKLLNVLTHTVKYKKENGEDREMYHIGIIYNVKLDSTKGELKTDPDGLDSNGACWLKISGLSQENLSPFAYQVISKL